MRVILPSLPSVMKQQLVAAGEEVYLNCLNIVTLAHPHPPLKTTIPAE